MPWGQGFEKEEIVTGAWGLGLEEEGGLCFACRDELLWGMAGMREEKEAECRGGS